MCFLHSNVAPASRSTSHGAAELVARTSDRFDPKTIKELLSELRFAEGDVRGSMEGTTRFMVLEVNDLDMRNLLMASFGVARRTTSVR